ncbi:MAG: hypothetical protein AAFY76_06865 [Cyanobacteria bacterium J06649_11]
MIDILKMVNEYPVSDRLILIEEILKSIRKESDQVEETKTTESDLSEFIGIIDDEEAASMKLAVEDSRKIDLDGW